MDTSNKTPRVTGIGGIFFKSEDPAKLNAWYKDQLGLDFTEWGGVVFEWGGGSENPAGQTVFNVFPKESAYYPGNFMINFRVVHLEELLAKLRANGDKVDDLRDEADFGKFAWVYDPEGNKIELWEPSDAVKDS